PSPTGRGVGSAAPGPPARGQRPAASPPGETARPPTPRPAAASRRPHPFAQGTARLLGGPFRMPETVRGDGPRNVCTATTLSPIHTWKCLVFSRRLRASRGVPQAEPIFEGAGDRMAMPSARAMLAAVTGVAAV